MTTPTPSVAAGQRARQCLEGLQHDRTTLDLIDNYLRGVHAGPLAEFAMKALLVAVPSQKWA